MQQTSRERIDDHALVGSSDAVHASEVADLLDAAGDSALDCVGRSSVFSRMSDGTLPFAGRAAYLEQHWEGLRILRAALGTPGLTVDPLALAPMRTALAAVTDSFAVALDRAHATARWRDRHVTMPSMLQFRRHIGELQDAGDTLGLVAHTYLRLTLARACPGPAVDESADPASLQGVFDSLVVDEESLELLSEELSAALLLLMQHGSDVCRGYHERDADSSCALTVSTIRRALQ